MSAWFFLQKHKPVVMPATKDTEDAYGAVLGIDPEKGTTSFDDRIRKEYRLHTAQYWFVATLANGLLWLQIVIGAALTALGASGTRQSQKATIYLGAANTITAGLLTYFKSRNQPNRARQLRQALRSVRNNMDDQSRELAGLTPEQARDAAQRIIKQYNDALATAAANYPDFWATLGDLRKFLPDRDPYGGTDGDHPGRNSNQSGAGPKPDEHGADASSSPTRPPKQPESHKGSSETHVESGGISPQRNSTSVHTPTPAPAPAPPSNQEKSAN